MGIRVRMCKAISTKISYISGKYDIYCKFRTPTREVIFVEKVYCSTPKQCFKFSSFFQPSFPILKTFRSVRCFSCIEERYSRITEKPLSSKLTKYQIWMTGMPFSRIVFLTPPPCPCPFFFCIPTLGQNYSVFRRIMMEAHSPRLYNEFLDS